MSFNDLIRKTLSDADSKVISDDKKDTIIIKKEDGSTETNYIIKKAD